MDGKVKHSRVYEAQSLSTDFGCACRVDDLVFSTAMYVKSLKSWSENRYLCHHKCFNAIAN